jgi:colicin import membrane protein
MMADIGSLAFKLTASGAQATAEMDRVRKAMQEMDREAKKTGSANYIQTRIGMLGGDAASRMSEARQYAAERGKSSTLAGAYDPGMHGFGGSNKKSDYDAIGRRQSMGLESTIKLAAQATAAITAADIATKLWEGDLAGAADTIKGLPFGVGQVATMLESIVGRWSGITAEIEETNRYLKMQEQMNQSLLEQDKLRRDFQREMTENARRADRERGSIGLTGVQAEVYTIETSRQGSIKAIDDQLEAQKRARKELEQADLAAVDEYRKGREEEERKIRNRQLAAAGSRGFAPSLQTMSGDGAAKFRAETEREVGNRRAAIQRKAAADLKVYEQQAAKARQAQNDLASEKERNADRTDADERMAEKRRAQEEQERKAEQARTKEERSTKEANDKARLARQAASDVTSVEAEIAAKSLDLQGRKLDAERVRLKEHYRQRIEAAREAGNAELASRLELEEKLALAGTNDGAGQTAEQVIRGRFALGSMTGKKQKMPIEGDPKQTEYLRQMAEALVRGVTGRAG